jgi:hypothetical protein
MNPDSPAFVPKSKSGDTGLKANKFGLSFDNVTKRDIQKSDLEDETVIPEFDGSGGTGDNTGSRGGSGGDNADLVGSFLEALKLMMKSKTEDSESDDDSIPAGTVLASGITLPTAVRSKDNFLSTSVQISRHNRGKTVEAQRKLRDRVCVKLDHTLKLTKWDEILDPRSDSDLGTAVISLQTQIDGVVEFCVIHDLA